MATSINKVTILGNLGRDPELRTTPTGLLICTLSIATTESYKDKTTGEWKENTDWHRVTLWDNLAKRAGEYLHKGNKVYIEGRLKYGSYDGKDGQKVYTTDVYATDMILLNRDSSASSNMNSASAGGATGNYAYNPAENFAMNDNKQFSPSSSSITDQLASHLTPDIEDDDVPF